MPFRFDDKLVVAVSSRALFDLSDEHAVFERSNEKAYREYQRQHEEVPLNRGVAFAFVQRLLGLNKIADDPDQRLVEVVLLSRNDADTGLRIFNSIAHHELDITRAVFTRGGSKDDYLAQLHAELFLSADPDDVRRAIDAQQPAGLVIEGTQQEQSEDAQLRIAFDMDGVLADDAPEQVYQTKGKSAYHRSEAANATKPLNPGPLKGLLERISHIQQIEMASMHADGEYTPRLRTAIVTARNAPAHERVITTLREWGVHVDEAMFLGGADKTPFLSAFQPHIFFEDQMPNAASASQIVPSVHIPYGQLNQG
jgi:5'-nucleotidase